MKNLRKEKGISQKKMAERLNLIPSAYSNYENLICEIPVEVMQKFCEEVECSMEELIEFDIGNLDEVHPVSSLSDLILSIMELNKKDPGAKINSALINTSGNTAICIFLR